MRKILIIYTYVYIIETNEIYKSPARLNETKRGTWPIMREEWCELGVERKRGMV